MILSVFSPSWFIIMALCAGFCVGIPLFFRGKTQEERENFLYKLSLFTIGFFILYKIWLFCDPTYDTSIWEELPTNLCNVGTLLMPLAIKKDVRWLRGLIFFDCPLGGLMALLMPSEGFYDVPVYLLRNIGYWGTHSLILILSLSLVTLGIYRPRFSDIPKSIAALFTLAFLNHILNTVLRATVCAESNFCFTYGIEGNPVTEWMMKLIPVPFLFLLPAAGPLFLANLGFLRLAGRKKPEKTIAR